MHTVAAADIIRPFDEGLEVPGVGQLCRGQDLPSSAYEPWPSEVPSPCQTLYQTVCTPRLPRGLVTTLTDQHLYLRPPLPPANLLPLFIIRGVTL